MRMLVRAVAAVALCRLQLEREVVRIGEFHPGRGQLRLDTL
jgi:hypothetical protein